MKNAPTSNESETVDDERVEKSSWFDISALIAWDATESTPKSFSNDDSSKRIFSEIFNISLEVG